MERTRAASRARRAAGTLREGGKAGRRLTGDVEEHVAPDEGDEGHVAMQARPGPSLVVAKPELLFAILMEAFDRPALVRQSELVVEGAVVEGPGEVPLGLTVLTRKGTFTDEPTEGTGGVAMCPVHAEPTRLPLAALLLGIEDGDRRPLLVGDASRQCLRGVQRCDLVGCGRVRGRPRRLASGRGWAAAAVTSPDSRTPNVLDTCTT